MFYLNFLFLIFFFAILNWILSNQLYFHIGSLGYDYYASARMVTAKLNHQII